MNTNYSFADGDLITIFDSSDLTGAIQSSVRTLKLTIFVNNKTETVEPEEKPSSGLANINSIRKELMAIRDQVIRVLDKIEPAATLDTPNGETASAPVEQQRESKPVHPTIIKPAINAGEFDPIQQQQQKHADIKSVPDNNKLYESFGAAAENAVTDGPLTPKPQGLQPSMMQQQGMMGHPQQQQQQQQQPLPPMGSPYQQPAYQSSQSQPPMAQQQLRFQPPQTSTGYSLPVQQQGPAYPQAGGYSPQPPQQQQQQQQSSAYAPGSMPYAPQAPQQQQATPAYNGPSQGYNPVQQPQQQQPAGMNPYPTTAAYPPSNAAPPTNPYSRGKFRSFKLLNHFEDTFECLIVINCFNRCSTCCGLCQSSSAPSATSSTSAASLQSLNETDCKEINTIFFLDQCFASLDKISVLFSFFLWLYKIQLV